MNSLTITVILALIGIAHNAKLPFKRTIQENNLLSNSLNSNPGRIYQSQEWIKISEAPPKVLKSEAGAHIELECEVIGSPNPRIQWIKDNQPITDDYELNNNVIIGATISKVKSRLIINNALPIHTGTITCYAESGIQTAIATTNLYITTQGNQNDSDFPNAEIMSTREQARIVLFNSFTMDRIGSNIVIPCKAIGKPKVDIYWFDNTEQLITNQNPKMKVLPNGDLSITNLAWTDMGSYTCLARNAFSKDSISTFIYPMLNEN